MHIRELSASDQPQYRLESLGSSALSDAEILALLLRRGGSGLQAFSLQPLIYLADVNGRPSAA